MLPVLCGKVIGEENENLKLYQLSKKLLLFVFLKTTSPVLIYFLVVERKPLGKSLVFSYIFVVFTGRGYLLESYCVRIGYKDSLMPTVFTTTS